MLIYFNQRAPPIPLIINDLQNFRPVFFLQTIGYQGFKNFKKSVDRTAFFL